MTRMPRGFSWLVRIWLACSIKERTSSSSWTCGYRGGDARCGASTDWISRIIHLLATRRVWLRGSNSQPLHRQNAFLRSSRVKIRSPSRYLHLVDLDPWGLFLLLRRKFLFSMQRPLQMSWWCTKKITNKSKLGKNPRMLHSDREKHLHKLKHLPPDTQWRHLYLLREQNFALSAISDKDGTQRNASTLHPWLKPQTNMLSGRIPVATSVSIMARTFSTA